MKVNVACITDRKPQGLSRVGSHVPSPLSPLSLQHQCTRFCKHENLFGNVYRCLSTVRVRCVDLFRLHLPLCSDRNARKQWLRYLVLPASSEPPASLPLLTYRAASTYAT